jgi:HAD superfamily hydrolase (TIGR01509 family)
MTAVVRPAYRAVVFDLFGTLIEFDPGRLPTLPLGGTAVPSTVPRYAERLRHYVPHVGAEQFAMALRTASEEVRSAGGDSLVETPSRERFRRALARVACPAVALDEAAAVLSRAHHEAIATATVFPPAHREVLALAAARGPVAVVSNFDDTSSAFAILARHAILPALATVVVSEAVGLRKPHPAMLATALATLGLAARDVLFVGDSFTADVGVAHALGADAAWIDAAGSGVPQGASAPRHVLRHLSELGALLSEPAG